VFARSGPEWRYSLDPGLVACDPFGGRKRRRSQSCVVRVRVDTRYSGSWFLVLGSWFLVLGSWFLVLGISCCSPPLAPSSSRGLADARPLAPLESWFLVLGISCCSPPLAPSSSRGLADARPLAPLESWFLVPSSLIPGARTVPELGVSHCSLILDEALFLVRWTVMRRFVGRVAGRFKVQGFWF